MDPSAFHCTPLRAIRAKCLDCCAGSPQEVRLCPVHDCPLYPFRFGRRPKTTATRSLPKLPSPPLEHQGPAPGSSSHQASLAAEGEKPPQKNPTVFLGLSAEGENILFSLDHEKRRGFKGSFNRSGQENRPVRFTTGASASDLEPLAVHGRVSVVSISLVFFWKG